MLLISALGRDRTTALTKTSSDWSYRTFLVEDLAPGGVVQADGDHKVHVINVEPNQITLDSHFDLDFNRDISTGPARPHGLVVFPPNPD